MQSFVVDIKFKGDIKQRRGIFLGKFRETGKLYESIKMKTRFRILIKNY